MEGQEKKNSSRPCPWLHYPPTGWIFGADPGFIKWQRNETNRLLENSMETGSGIKLYSTGRVDEHGKKTSQCVSWSLKNALDICGYGAPCGRCFCKAAYTTNKAGGEQNKHERCFSFFFAKFKMADRKKTIKCLNKVTLYREKKQDVNLEYKKRRNCVKIQLWRWESLNKIQSLLCQLLDEFFVIKTNKWKH